MRKMLTKWKYASGVVSIVLASCAFILGSEALLCGDYLLAMGAWYSSALMAVAGITSISFVCENREAIRLVLCMYLCEAIPGVALLLAERASELLPIVCWCAVCSAMSFLIVRVYAPVEDI